MSSPACEDPSSAAPYPSPSAADQAIYVYAFVDATRAGHLAPSVDTDEPVLLHRVGAISAVVSLVSTAEFHGIEGERNLADPAWLMPRICRHEAVVESAMQWSPVFPTRFATLYISLDSLTVFMLRHAAAIADFLVQVTGQQEWALKITADLGDLVALDDLASELWPGWSNYSPGKRYLQLRQERPGLLKVAQERAARQMPEIVDGLRSLATAVRPLSRSASAGVSGDLHTETCVFLAPVGQRTALYDRVNELVSEWKHRRFQIALSGPWPPYSFRPVLDVSIPRSAI